MIWGSKAFYDNLYPNRIVVVHNHDMREATEIFAGMLVAGAVKENIDVLNIHFTEAEVINLFANGHL